ncbi:uncharacterized protein BDR25DRAFT_359946 [Lindgomyces ingoldianus]|uniref:Uncharacterized protein n=1 Tax=Lindgomyces ingoldianus TaxID=673940 RepID=A0ACB6QJ40_9PLEO|nr:uncharacterized protein BDR25DRAFT_359946 [Lindgomyces ingoldianus]KAF2466161.1 hypothetical protein BDR25DRAFT_359946 [Lindgomyces ingoldianus]
MPCRNHIAREEAQLSHPNQGATNESMMRSSCIMSSPTFIFLKEQPSSDLGFLVIVNQLAPKVNLLAHRWASFSCTNPHPILLTPLPSPRTASPSHKLSNTTLWVSTRYFAIGVARLLHKAITQRRRTITSKRTTYWIYIITPSTRTPFPSQPKPCNGHPNRSDRENARRIIDALRN